MFDNNFKKMETIIIDEPKMYPLWSKRTDQNNCETTFINPTRTEPITESTSTAVRHLANNEYSTDHVFTGC